MNCLSALPRAGFVLVFFAALGLSATKEVDLRRDVDAATQVITGMVERVHSYYADDGEIYTDLTLRVTGVLKQETETPDTITFTIPGGEVGDEGVLYTSAPQFALEEPVLVFLEADESGTIRAASKYELDGRYLPEVKMRAGELLTKLAALLEEGGKPVRDSEWKRASSFVESAVQRNAGSAACYKLMGPKWRVNNITYKLDATLPAGFANAIAASVAPFNTAGTPLRISQNPFSANVVSYNAIQGTGILAQTRVTYQPATSTIVGYTLVFNRSFPWSLSGEANKFDVQGISSHEFGHAVGLTHPDGDSCNDQTMWFSASAGETQKRTLEVGDIAGMMVLYGPTPVVAAPPPSSPVPPPSPAPTPGQAPPVPVFSGMTTSGTLATSKPITLNVLGSTFVRTAPGLQFVIKGAGCPTTGCILDTRVLQNLTSTSARGIFTPSGGGSFTVRLRNTATGVQSDSTYRFSVAISVNR